MKIDRLIGIIITLQQKGKVTAPYLAEKFEVSRRTINRDIEHISRAGIPITTTQGADGGIKIMDGFSIDTTVFTKDELQAIFIGLKTLDSISSSQNHSKIAEKIGATISVTDDMLIDLSSFYKNSLSEKIELLKTAINQHKQITFHYYYSKGEEDKIIEPGLIVFKWSAWYVFGYCPSRNDFRMYKLNRLWNLQITDKIFQQKEIPQDKLSFGQNITDDKIITAVYEASEKYRLVEEYGPDSFSVKPDGRLYTQWGFTDYDSAVKWFLGFGDKVEVLAPYEFRDMLLEEIKRILERYK